MVKSVYIKLLRQKAVLIEAAAVWQKWLKAIFNDRDIAPVLIRHDFTFPYLSLDAQDFCNSPFHRGMMFEARKKAIAFLVDFFGEIPYLPVVGKDDKVNLKYNDAVDRLWGAMCRILYHKDMCPGHKHAADKYFPLE